MSSLAQWLKLPDLLPIYELLALWLLTLAPRWLGDSRENARHRQYWAPVLALALLLACCWLGFGLSIMGWNLDRLLALTGHLWSNVEQRLGVQLPLRILPALAVLGVYALGKPIVTIALFFVRPIIRFIQWLLGKLIGAKRDEVVEGAMKQLRSRLAIFWPYGTADGDAEIRPGWKYIAFFLIRAALLILVLLSLVIFLPLMDAISTLLVAASMLVLMEAGWFLSGQWRPVQKDAISGQDARGVPAATLDALVDRYQKIWPSRLVRAAKIESNARTPVRDSSDPERRYVQSLPVSFVGNNDHVDALKKILGDRSMVFSETSMTDMLPLTGPMLDRALGAGGRALFLVDRDACDDERGRERIRDWLQETIDASMGGPSGWVISGPDTLAPTAQIAFCAPDWLVAECRRESNSQWLSEVSLLVVLDVGTSGTALSTVDAAVELLNHLTDEMRVIAVSQVGVNAETWMLATMSIRDKAVDEINIRNGLPPVLRTMVWQREADGAFENAVFAEDEPPTGKIGAPMALAAVVAEHQAIPTVHFAEFRSRPFVDFLENLHMNVDRLIPAVRPQDKESLRKQHQNLVLAADRPVGSDTFVIANDGLRNFPLTVRRLAESSDQTAFVHVLTEPFLLREYFEAHLERFTRAPMEPFCPVLGDDDYAKAERLLKRLLTRKVSRSRLLRMMDYVPGGNVAFAIARLFQEAFGVDLLRHRLLRRADGMYWLEATATDHTELRWLRTLDIAMERNVLASVHLDHVYQRYLPGQYHVFGGGLYVIEAINEETGNVKVHKLEPTDEQTLYRQKTSIRVGPNKRQGRGDDFEFGDNRVTVNTEHCPVEISTKGYCEFKKRIDLSPNGHHWRAVSVPVRKYPSARCLRLTIAGPAVEAPWACPLAILVSEAIRSFLPAQCELLRVLPLSDCYHHHKLESIFPTLAPESDNAMENNTLALLVVEDSHQDLGAVEVLERRWRDVLTTIRDYLEWWTEDPGRDAFLNFGLGDLARQLDFEGVLSLLNNIMPPDVSADTANAANAANAATMGRTCVCDICGDRQPVDRVQKLADGRDRCSSCTAEAIDSVEDIKVVYRDARQFFEKHFEIKIRSPIDVRIADAHEIASATDRIFQPTEEYDGRAVGLAIRKGKDYTIMIENGCPRFMAAAVIVHELTHIWQYENCDVRALEKKYGLKMIEGHATWAEHTYLTDQRVAPRLRRRIETRQDPVYGDGYRAYRDRVAGLATVAAQFRLIETLV